MACEAKDINKSDGFGMETWSGIPKQNGIPAFICAIDDNKVTVHFVEIKNLKSLARTIYVKGILLDNTARLDGPNIDILKQNEWNDKKQFFASTKPETLQFHSMRIAKKGGVTGQERVKVEIEYENSWSPIKKRVDRPTHPLVFQIDVQ